LAGRPVPQVKLPEPLPLEALYPPRELSWTDTSFVEFKRDVPDPPTEARDLETYLSTHLAPSHFRNLNNAQATGALRMMIADVEETRLGFGALLRQTRRPLLAGLDSPYPFMRYLAFNALTEG